MPEGDTLVRTAAGLRPHLVGRVIGEVQVRPPGPRPERIRGATVTSVDARGKHLLIGLDSGLALRTHLGMHGSWHRYRPGERWRRPASRARIVLEVPGTVAVCFDAVSVDLFEARAEALHPILGALGPDLSAAGFDSVEAVRRLAAPVNAGRTIAEALLDQRNLAGAGNVFKSEVLFIERIDPFAPVESLGHDALERIVPALHELLTRNRTGTVRTTTGGERAAGRSRLWVYGRGGHACLRCGTPIGVVRHGVPPRLTYWCPTCQPSGAPVPRPATGQAPRPR